MTAPTAVPTPPFGASPDAAMLAAVVEASGAGIVVHDATRPGQPIVYCNRAFLEMVGYGADEVIGRNSALLQGPDTDPETAATIRSAMAEARPLSVEVLNYRKDGSAFWNALTLRPVPGPAKGEGAGGRPRWIAASCADVTRSRRSEQELRAAEEQLTRLAAETFALAEKLDGAREEAEAAQMAAENASRAKSRFLAMMSHELRTPMTAVIGMGDLLMGTGLSEQQKSFVRTLRSSADTLMTILNDVLDFSKIEAGQLTLEEIDFSLPRLVDDVVQLFLVRAAAKGLTLSASIADDTPRHIRGDPTRLRQVLFNLVSNAIKFTERGAIEIAVWSPDPPVAPSTGRAGEEDAAKPATPPVTLRFEVQDSGIGMTAEQRGRLFDAFVQADVSTSRKYGGTGLGLAICKRLVEAMDGEIAVASAPGRGSTFRFSIRTRVAEAQPLGDLGTRGLPAMSAEEPQQSAVALRLLLAEDNDINRMLITAMMTRIGHRIDAVNDGRAVLDAIKAADYDVLILDMEMPVLDGRSTARAIRRMDGPMARIPIVGLSADALPEHRDGHMAAGLDAYLTKPIDWEQLNAVLVDLATRPEDGRVVPIPSRPALEGGHFMAFPLLDRVKLAELRLALGGTALDGMLQLLPETALRELTAIRSALQDGRPKELKQAAHTLSGLAANFGAPRMAAIARAINDNPGDTDKVAALLPLLETTVGATGTLVREPAGSKD
ncbi:hybrid sensor histidine kinase/response regulator (plasmid) [Azospirillum humicireducens]|uniref:Sensory/regulatory protein RpfC n=1 Tax=Azospirillum humicireducens TaxID=1226968 RepID=A0A2R4VR94_9PROT|nr:ATP-binding protein [Azospirillum humicireducens]AWB06964.1 hybrid sensor histidine kinase/response regulator [Azospirillum humicireducens]